MPSRIDHSSFLQASDFSTQLAAKADRFEGREWLIDRINDWLVGDGENCLLIQGPPGSGKSALVAQLARTNQAVAAVHLCSAEDLRTLRVSSVIRNIASGLARCLPEYGVAVANAVEPHRLSIQVDIQAGQADNIVGVVIENLHAPNPADELDILLLKPLSRLERPTRPVAVLIDALDESLTLPVEHGIALLLAQSRHFPPWLKLLCTSRADERVTASFRHATLLNLDLEVAHVKQDIRTYIKRRLATADSTSFSESEISALVDACSQEPNYLHATCLVEDVILHPDRYLDRDLGVLLQPVPTNLNEMFLLFLDRLQRSRWESTYQPILGSLCVAMEPWSEQQLAKYSGVGLGVLRRDALAIAQFLKCEADPDGIDTIRLFHPSFRRFLLDSEKSRSYYCDEVEAHRTLLRTVASADAGARSYSKFDRYLRSRWVDHLVAARDDTATQMVLTSFDWAREKIGDLGIDAVIADFECGSSCITGARQVCDALRRVRHILARDTTQFAGQLISELSDDDALSSSLLADAANFRGKTSLKPMNHCVEEKRDVCRQTFVFDHNAECVAVSGDGSRAIIGLNNTLMLLDLVLGREIRSFSLHEKRIDKLAISEDGTWFASTGHWEAIYIWNVEGLLGRLDFRLVQSAPMVIAGNRLFVTVKREDLDDQGELLCWDRPTESYIAFPLPNPSYKLLCGCGDFVLVAGQSRAYLWRASDLQELKQFDIPEELIRTTNADMTPDGRLVAVQNTFDGTVVVLDALDGSVYRQFKHPGEHGEKELGMLAFADSGSMLGLLRCDLDNSQQPSRLSVWDVEQSELLLEIDAHSAVANELAGSASGPLFVSASLDGGGEVVVWQPREFRSERGPASVRSNRIVALAQLGCRLLSASSNGTVCMWDLSSATKLGAFEAHPDGLISMAVDRNSEEVFTVGCDGTLIKWDILLQTMLWTGPMQKEGMLKLVSPLGGGSLICFFTNNAIGRYTPGSADFEIDFAPVGSPRCITGIGADAGGKRIALVHAFGGQNCNMSADWASWQVAVWDVGRAEVIDSKTFKGYDDCPTPALSPDGELLYVATGKSVECLRIDRVKNDDVKISFEHSAAVSLISLDVTGRYLATVTKPPWLRVWDAKLATPIADFGLNIMPSSLLVTEGGEHVCVGSENGGVLILGFER